MLNEQEIKTSLQALRLPLLEKLGEEGLPAQAIKKLELKDRSLFLEIELGYPIDDIRAELGEQLQEAVLKALKLNSVELKLGWKVEPHGMTTNLKPIPGVKNTIAIASGKGGVGKSTTTVNLALALSQQGARVGILDADIYGPNQPQMLGATGGPLQAPSGQLMQPVVLQGIQSMSIGYLLESTTPAIWRGPMVSSALQQLVWQTQWSDLDYLLIDLPPGTGDIQLTLSQKVPVSGAIVVTTPQDIALLDARKALEMFRKVKVPILGIVENMSMHICSACGHADAIFGTGGGERMAQACDTPLLGQLPLSRSIREDADRGCPTVISAPKSAEAQAYHEIARLMAAKLARQAINYTVKFPRIVME